MRYLFIILFLISITGCETPKEQSSLPWSRPEPWETQVLPSVEE